MCLPTCQGVSKQLLIAITEGLRHDGSLSLGDLDAALEEAELWYQVSATASPLAASSVHAPALSTAASTAELQQRLAPPPGF